ncbi:ethanolamine utilization protein EutA (predicted chaperonin) [Saccharothrix tamanrassetensis]|uniref:Ethanolamine utilization protein EutA (Predicted chaperonin) n=1 Tax=Saccharothrix tamanrassetensis TaxID=1051531 RepID=A0A841CJ00_9PSEU|nr:DUF3040 domain-containing protein [Saccharothrix tamanrassetensis]MBB5957279.1 ethanolamine utilization protein EutA (predicted chaperonin) [Saccharothrix tamanrassetensis]
MTRYERRQLRRIERWFETTDPELAAVLAGRTTGARPAHRPSTRTCVAVLGIAFVVGGALVQLSLAFAGCLLLMTAACLHVTRPRPAKP